MKILQKYFSKRFLEYNNQDLNHDFHIHTNWTDGEHSVQEIINEANSLRISSIGFSDHIRSTSTYFFDYYNHIKSIKNTKLNIFVGCEAKIIDQNQIDIAENINKRSDFIIASVHSLKKNKRRINSSQLEYKEAEQIEYDMLLNFTPKQKNIFIGHPFGMTIKHHNKFNIKYFENFVKQCVSKDILFEISAAYHKKYINEIFTILKKYNPRVIFNSDAHKKQHLTSWKKLGLKF